MHDAHPSNSAIKKALAKSLPELAKRYGRSDGCTYAQVTKVADDFGISKDVRPYICAILLAEEDFQKLRAELPAVQWEEAERRSERIVYESQSTGWSGNSFYESGIGMPDPSSH